MQRWSPEAFDPAATGTTVVRGDGAVFTPLAGAALAAGPVAGDRRFRSESGFGDPRVLMAQLSAPERAVVCDLVEQDVSRRYAEQEAALRAELEEARRRDRQELQQAQDAFAAAWQEQHDARLREIAVAAARLAVQLAGKLVRRAAAADPETLARTLETVLYGAGARGPLTVTVHPDDAAWLDARPELRERLRIGDLVHDRRIDRGGCVVAADGREWDATLQGQLETLGEVVEEWLTVERPDGGGGA